MRAPPGAPPCRPQQPELRPATTDSQDIETSDATAMRVSILSNDPGYANYAALRRIFGEAAIKIFVNGRMVRFALTADEEANEVVAVREDDRGDVMVEGGKAVVMTIMGKVEIRIEKPEPVAVQP